MGQLVDDLLAFSRLGRLALTKQTVDPGKMVRLCLAEMQKEQEGRQLEIVIGDLPSCQADPTLLKQVWIEFAFQRPEIHAQAGGGAHRDWLPNGAAAVDQPGMRLSPSEPARKRFISSRTTAPAST